MGGGLMQLVAMGAQDVFLTGNPSQTFFKQRYQRHTNFAAESIEQTFDGKVGYGARATCTIKRNGDLLSALVVEITLKRGSEDTFYPAEHLLREVVLEIGGQRVDVLTNTWLRVYDELYRKVDGRAAYEDMANFMDEPNGSLKRFYVPLPFWFCCGNYSSALPLVALQYHEVKLHFEFEKAANIPGIDAVFEPEIALWADYVYLDTDERRQFAQTSHEYLIEQTQMVRESVRIGVGPKQFNITLPFNHPVKYLAWVFKKNEQSHGTFTALNDNNTDSTQAQLYAQGLESMEVCAPLARCGLQLNGIERFKPRRGSFFRLAHPAATFGHAPSAGVYVYSFALHPTQAFPTGTLNCSRIDSIVLQLHTKAATLASVNAASTEDQTLASATDLRIVEVYARNFNVFRIMSGMGGLAFSN